MNLLGSVCLFLCFASVAGHTLVVCTDLSQDLQTCNGWARNVNQYMTSGDGYVIDADKNGPPCSGYNTLNDRAYSTKYPMAKAQAGATLKVGWPSNNHQKANPAGGVPDSRNSGDLTVKIWRTTNSQPGRDILTSQQDLVTPSYSNCFKDFNKEFAKGSAGDPSGKYMCTTDLVMPQAEGTYTFVWAWKLAGPYYSCFDVQVGANAARPPTAPQPPTAPPAPTPAPGGGGGGCVQAATDYCIGRGYSGCTKRADGAQYCGSASTATGGGTGGGGGANGCPAVVTDFCKNNYNAGCEAIGGGSYRCVMKQTPQSAAAEAQVVEVVDNIPATSDIVKGVEQTTSGASAAAASGVLVAVLAAVLC